MEGKMILTNDSAMTYLESTTENSLTFEPYPSRPYELSLICVMAVTGLYLCVVCILYSWKDSEKSLILTNRLIVSASCFLFVQSFWFLLEVVPQRYQLWRCRLFYVVNSIFSMLNRLLINMILWLRQRQLYQNQVLPKSLVGKADVASKITIVGFAVLPLVILIANALAPISKTSQGCFPVESFSDFVVIPSLLLIVLCQFVLIALVILPLVLAARLKNSARLNKAVKKALIRVAVCSCITVATDLVLAGLIVAFRKFLLGIISPSMLLMINPFNTMLNLLLMLFTFRNYVKRLLPFKGRTNVVVPQ